MTDPAPHGDLAEASALAASIADVWALLASASRSRGGLPTLPPTQATALRRIIAAGSAGATPTALAVAMNVSRPMVSELVRRLEDEGLVARARSEADGRSIVVTATAHGLDVHRAFHLGVSAVMAEAMAALGARERARLLGSMESLERLRAALTGVVGTGPRADRPTPH